MPENPEDRNTNIVVVNDSRTQLQLLCGLLEKLGLSPQCFSAAEEALQALAQQPPPDLIITDLYMPGMDGWRFCRLLRSPQYLALNPVPILVVSATYAGDDPSRIIANLGANAFLSAPVEGRQLAEGVQRLLAGDLPAQRPAVLVVAADQLLCSQLETTFQAYGYGVEVVSSAAAARQACQEQRYDVALLETRLPDGEGSQLLDELKQQQPDCACLVLAAEDQADLAAAWLQRGAYACLQRPVQVDYLLELCDRARRERALLRIPDVLETRTQQLAESERLGSAILKTVQDGFWVIDMRGRHVAVNQAYCRMSGYSEQELLSMSIADIDAEESPAETRARIQRIVENGAERFETRHRRKDGSLYDVELSVTYTDREGGQFICFCRDITERKQMEKALRLQHDLLERLYRIDDLHQALALLLESLLELGSIDCGGVYAVDPQSGDLHLVMQRGLSVEFAASVARQAAGSITGRLARQGRVYFRRGAEPRAEGEAMRRKEGLRAEAVLPILHQGKLQALVRLSSRSVDDFPLYIKTTLETLSHQVGHILARLHDMAALKESESRFRSLVAQSFDGILIADQYFRIIEWNQAQTEIFGYTREEMLGAYLWDFAMATASPELHTPHFLSRLKGEMLREAGEEGFDWQKNLRTMEIRHKNGSPRTVQISKFPIDLSGAWLYCSVARDITLQRQAELQIRQEKEKNRMYLDIAGVMLVAIDQNGCISMINQKGLEILGYAEKELLGRNWFDTCIPAVLREEVRSVFARIMAGEIVQLERYENPVLTQGGQERIIAWNNTHIHVENGEIVGTLSSGEDITERKRSEAKILEQLEELRRWHKITLGREDRILKLKAEVNELLARAGEPPRYASVETGQLMTGEQK